VAVFPSLDADYRPVRRARSVLNCRAWAT